MKGKKLMIAAVSVFSVAVIIAVFLMIWFWGDRYSDFNQLRKEFAIPDLESGGSPQGLANYYNGEYEVKTPETDEDGQPVLNDDGSVKYKTENKRQNFFFISSYLPNGQASRVYVYGEQTGYIGFVTLKNTDGTPHTGHVGGIAINRDFLWISSQHKTTENGKTVETGAVFAIKKSNNNSTILKEIVEKAQNSGDPDYDNSVEFTAYFNAQGNASFLYYFDADGGASDYVSYNDRLYVGEFYRKGDKYGTAETHHLTTPQITDEKTKKMTGGANNKAFAYEYSVNAGSSESNKLGLYTLSNTKTVDGQVRTYKSDSGFEMPQIQNIFSLPNEVQGFARTSNGTPDDSTDDKLVVSVSYGLKNSKLYYYSWDKVASTNSQTSNRKPYNSADLFGKYYQYEDFYYDYGNGERRAYEYDSTLYVHFVDNTALLRTYDIPCMSEGLCVMRELGEDRVYVLFESGAKQYKFFVRQVLTNVYSFIPERKQ